MQTHWRATATATFVAAFVLLGTVADSAPNFADRIERPLRYRPEGTDFVIENGTEFFNRPLYGNHTAFRVDAGDKPEFSLYLPGRDGNLRLAVRHRRFRVSPTGADSAARDFEDR